jgi:hypothetical protein
VGTIVVVAESGAEVDRINFYNDKFEYATGAGAGIVNGLARTGMTRGNIFAALSDWSNGYLTTRKIPSDMPTLPPIPGLIDFVGTSVQQTAAVGEFQGDIPDQLADYWLRGKGAARVRWCTRGAFRRARRLLRGKVPAEMLDGTVANLYHRACGRWPGRRGNEASFAEMDSPVVAPEDSPQIVGDDEGERTYKRVDWNGPLAPIDIATGDRRRFAPGALSTRQLPLPFRWQEKAAQGHDGSVVVGALTGYDIADDGTIMGRGYFLDPEVIPDVRKAMHLVEHGVVGPSVDLEPDMDVVAADEAGEEFDPDACAEDGNCPDKPQALITRATIAGATLVPITAFAEARAPQLTPHGEFCLNPLHPGPCAGSGSGGGGGGGKDKKADTKATPAAPTGEQGAGSNTPAQAPGRGVLDALVREKFLDAPQTPNDDRTPEERQADDERAAERAKVENRRARRAEVRAKAAAARERYGPRSKWPKRVRTSIERDEERAREMSADQTASTSLTACGCATRAGVTEFSVSTDGTTCACDPDGVARPMSAGGEFCACSSSQTADAGDEEHADCRENEFCRSPLHPGPCKGWKNKGKSGDGDSGGTSKPASTRAKRAPKAKPEDSPAPDAKPKDVGPPPKHVKDARDYLTGDLGDRKTLPTSLLLGGVSEESYRDHFTPEQRKKALGELLVIQAGMGDEYTGRDKPAVTRGVKALEGQVPGDHQALAEAEAERQAEKMRAATKSLETKLQKLWEDELADTDNTQEDLVRTRDAFLAQSRYARERTSKAEAVLAKIRATRAGQESNQTAAVRDDFDGLPIAHRDMAWDVGAAEQRISAWATDDDGDIDFQKYGRAFIYQDPDAPADTKSAYKFPVATIVDGELTIVPRAVFAAAGRLNQANVSSDAREQIRETVTDLYDQMAEEFDDDTLQNPWEMAMEDDGEYDELEHDLDASGNSAVDVYGADVHGGEFCGECGGDPLEQVAAAYGVFGDIAPYPIEAFQRTASGPTPMTILEDGSVFGHIAPWDSCNRGVRGRCLPPPKSKTNYAQFHTSPIRTSEGTLRVGKIVMGEGHADVNGNMQVTKAWYDKAGKTAAHGRAHEDEWGVFFSGVIGPNLTPAEAVEFFSMPPSGHWTEHRPTRSSELIAVAAVNIPGHPIGAPDLVLNQIASGYYEPDDGGTVQDAAAVFSILDQADWQNEAAALAFHLI